MKQFALTMKRFIGVLGVVLLATLCRAQDSRTPVLLELFTSEGCSSCPPADALLSKIDRVQPVRGIDLIVVEEHVDYWNHGGWSDPYSSASFSERQQHYASLLHINDVYTPQLVIDGVAQVVGSDWSKAKSAIEIAQHSRKLAILLDATPSVSDTAERTLTAKVAPDSELPAGDVYLVVAADSMETDVKSGENSGRHLSHTAVAYSFTKIGKTSMNAPFEMTIKLPPHSKWGSQSRIIVFVQDPRTGRVLGISETKLKG